MKNTLRPQIYNNSPTKILYIHVINGQHRRLQTSSNYTSRPREFLLHTCIYIYFRSNSFEMPDLVVTFSVNKADNPPSCSKCQNVSFFFFVKWLTSEEKHSHDKCKGKHRWENANQLFQATKYSNPSYINTCICLLVGKFFNMNKRPSRVAYQWCTLTY